MPASASSASQADFFFRFVLALHISGTCKAHGTALQASRFGIA
jgi:hypothetical protein